MNQSDQRATSGGLLVFASCVVLWSHHAARSLPFNGARVIIQVIVVVGCRCGHRKNARNIELHVYKNTVKKNRLNCIKKECRWVLYRPLLVK